jgi:hypothetical protein
MAKRWVIPPAGPMGTAGGNDMGLLDEDLLEDEPVRGAPETPVTSGVDTVSEKSQDAGAHPAPPK